MGFYRKKKQLKSTKKLLKEKDPKRHLAAAPNPVHPLVPRRRNPRRLWMMLNMMLAWELGVMRELESQPCNRFVSGCDFCGSMPLFILINASTQQKMKVQSNVTIDKKLITEFGF